MLKTYLFFVLFLTLAYIGDTDSPSAESTCYNIEPTYYYEIAINEKTLPKGLIVKKVPSYYDESKTIRALINETITPLQFKNANNRFEYKQIADKQFYRIKSNPSHNWKVNHISGKNIPYIILKSLLPSIPNVVTIDNKVITDVPNKPFSFTVQYGEKTYLIKGEIKYSINQRFDMQRFISEEKEILQYACTPTVYLNDFKNLNLKKID